MFVSDIHVSTFHLNFYVFVFSECDRLVALDEFAALRFRGIAKNRWGFVNNIFDIFIEFFEAYSNKKLPAVIAQNQLQSIFSLIGFRDFLLAKVELVACFDVKIFYYVIAF